MMGYGKLLASNMCCMMPLSRSQSNKFYPVSQSVICLVTLHDYFVLFLRPIHQTFHMNMGMIVSGYEDVGI
jgi:hypothetical protein